MQKIRIDFDNPGLPQHISAVENDSQSRFFQATLYENGKAYTAPEGAAYSIMYRGFGPQNQGWYDTINDGAGKRAACKVSGNVVTCEIARQALQVPGHVSIVLCVTTGKGYMLKSWPIECDCKNDRYDSTEEIESFFYVTQISNESWTQAIQAVEELKNTIDPTLSLSGKAADAKATGDAVVQLKEDLSKLMNDDGIDFNQVSGAFTTYRKSEIQYVKEDNRGYYITGSYTVGTVGSAQITKPTSRTVLDLENCTGLLKFAINPEVSMYSIVVLIVGDSIETGANILDYFSYTSIPKNPYELFDISNLTDGYAYVNIDKLKNQFPTAKGLFINQPTSVWLLEGAKINVKKKLEWLDIGNVEYTSVIVVATDGSGDYVSIQEAIDNATDGTTIYIKDGEYKETAIVDKYVHLVGQSKQGTILYQNIGDYANCPLLITQGSVCNMTIKSLAPSDTSDLSDYAYAIHLDKNFAGDSEHRKCEIYNCYIISEVNDAVGAGTNYDEVFDLHDNYIYVVANPVKTGACGFKCHIGASQTGGKITLKNNTIIAENSNGTSFYDVLLHDGGLTASIKIPVELIGNVCKTFRNVSTVYELNQYCYGNSVPEMNTLN